MANEKDTGILTVAAVRKGKDGKEILFNERQQVFSLASSMKSADEVLKRLKGAIKRKEPVRAVLNPSKGSPRKDRNAQRRRG